jgi:hypothetical protein
VITGAGSPLACRIVTTRCESICLAVEAAVIESRRVSRVSIPSRARRMSDCSNCRERARRRRFSDNADRGRFPVAERVGEGGLCVDAESVLGGLRIDFGGELSF